MKLPVMLAQKSGRAWIILGFAVKTFVRIDGAQWAAAFAHYAFFSLFPLVILFATITSLFIERGQAGREIIAFMETYVPIGGDKERYVFDTIASVVAARGSAGLIAFLMLVWAAMRSFTTLIRVTNQAWGSEAHAWWRLPLKSLVLLALLVSAVTLGVAVPLLAKMAKDWLVPADYFSSWVDGAVSFFAPLLVVFYGLSYFYRLAPRRRTSFAEVWAAALCATALLRIAESLFAIYLKHFATLNAVYGAFGGIMALLLWIYLSGCIFIFGACLCAARAEGPSAKSSSAHRGLAT